MMKRLLLFFVATLPPLFAFEMNADERKEVKDIPLNSVSDKKTIRGLVEIPMDATYYGMLSAIHTVVTSDIGEVEMTVTNCVTGECWYGTFDSGAEPQNILAVSGTSGCYEVVYATETGNFYEGTFIIE